MWLGIDDTDSRQGGCTTWVALQMIKKIPLDVIGYPKLVRLNPNLPWKTRGNGAVCIRFGKGYGRRRLIGVVNGKRLWGWKKCKEVKNSIETQVENVMEKHAWFEDENTNPGFVIARDKIDAQLYWEAVHEIVKVNKVKKLLSQKKIIYRGYKNQRGIVGSAAAAAWEGLNKTYEIIAYRDGKGRGTRRSINENSVITMDKNYPSTFDNYDYENRYLAIAPRSPCSVLFGIRGEEPAPLPQALCAIGSEPTHGWLLFETNQATDDHLIHKKISKVKPYQSAIIRGVVSAEPRTIAGGHTIFSLSDNTDRIECATYEPTKGFRKVIRKLRKGDKVLVCGGVRAKPLTLNIEKIRVERVVPVWKKVIPRCPTCGKRMSSAGKAQGYRCKHCRTKAAAQYARVKRELKAGWYEVPVCARRHLAMPLRRMTA